MKRNFIFNSLLFLSFSLTFVGCKKEEKETVIETGSVSDVDGNTYKTVKIGDQWWMAENLRTSSYNDGSKLITYLATDADSTWEQQKEGAMYLVDSTSNGALYNWETVNSKKKLAPKGWHIPSDEEWKTLEKTIGLAESDLNKTAWRGTNEGSKLVTKGSQGWASTVLIYGIDLYGFNAKPAGCVVFDGKVNSSKNTAFWWTSTPYENEAWYRYIDGNKNQIFRQHTYKSYGFSVRCIKD